MISKMIISKIRHNKLNYSTVRMVGQPGASLQASVPVGFIHHSCRVEVGAVTFHVEAIVIVVAEPYLTFIPWIQHDAFASWPTVTDISLIPEAFGVLSPSLELGR